jgi:hypothetical protein
MDEKLSYHVHRLTVSPSLGKIVAYVLPEGPRG